MKTKFTADIKVIEVLDKDKYSVGTIRKGTSRFFARSNFNEDEVLFNTERAARAYLIDKANADSLNLPLETYIRTQLV
jgi:hypothetical protein